MTKRFKTYASAVAFVKEHGWIGYHAALDHAPRRARAVVVKDTIRIIPDAASYAKSHPLRVDPFDAGRDRLSLFRQPD